MVHGSSPTHKTRARALRGLETAAVRRPPRPWIWMRPPGNHFMRFLPLGAFVAAVGLAGFLLPACPTTALAQPSRSIQVGLSAGARSFASRLDLSSEFA